MLSNMTIKDFLARTASKNPVPGGGSVSALAGALAASLITMVTNLTIGKKGFEEVSPQLEPIREKAQILEAQLRRDIDRDADAFDSVMAAFRLPRETEEEKQHRSQAIQDAYKSAAQVPMEVAHQALELIEMAATVIAKGNPNALTDAAVATMMARTAVLGALYNVKINLSAIKDNAFVDLMQQQVDAMEVQVKVAEAQTLSQVKL